MQIKFLFIQNGNLCVPFVFVIKIHVSKITLDFDKTHENSIKNNSFVSILFDVVLKIQLSKITVSSYFDEFPFLCLW